MKLLLIMLKNLITLRMDNFIYYDIWRQVQWKCKHSKNNALWLASERPFSVSWFIHWIFEIVYLLTLLRKFPQFLEPCFQFLKQVWRHTHGHWLAIHLYPSYVLSERYKSHNTRNEMAPFTVESMQLGICTNVCYQCASVIHQARWALSYSIFTIG